jgi:16S rRNA (adenine1518-N6/adenine1519-N6)-dimethyltransferase
MRARKRFGQHFLVDDAVLDALLRHINPRFDDRMLEVGPGRGALTELLCAELKTLHAIELDRDLIGGLARRFANLALDQGDVLAVDFATRLAANDWRIVGNLPYNLSTPLLLLLATHAQHIKDIHFMLQLELAQRLAAVPGTKSWGRLSVTVQRRWLVESLFDVAPTAFSPPPKVMSQVVRLTPREVVVELRDEALFARLLLAAFGQRRKTLSNSLRDFNLDFAAFDLQPRQRAEEVRVDQYVAMANSLAASHQGGG